MTRKGQVWRGEIAERIQAHLDGAITAEDLIDWALEHPFYDDQTDLDDPDRRAIANALGHILQLDQAEAADQRTTAAMLPAVVDALWGTAPPPTGDA